MINIKKAFRTASTIEAKAEIIVQYLTEAGLSPDHMLEVLKMARERIEPKPASWNETNPLKHLFDRPEFKAYMDRIEQERAQGKMK